MALDYDTANSGLFSRFGRIARGVGDKIAILGGTATSTVTSGASLRTRATNLETDCAASPALSHILDGHWRSFTSDESAQASFYSAMRNLAERLLIEQVHLDASLTSKTLLLALQEIERQMRLQSESINGSTISLGSQTNVGTPTGNAVFVGTIKNHKGWKNQTSYAETVRFIVTSDADRGATARQEPVTIAGTTAAPGPFDRTWPAGSGATQRTTLVDAQLDDSGGNLLYNSDFETYSTSNYPDNWVIAVGAASTNVFQGSSQGYTGSSALKITGDGGGTLTCLRQTFDGTPTTGAGTGATSGSLEPNTRYAIHLRMKRDNTLSAGVLRIRLVDGSNAVISDDAGTECSFTCDLTTLTASYASFSGVVITPLVMPSTVKLELALTTAIDNADSCFIDDLAMAEMVQLYPGGPSFAGFAGATDVAFDDRWTMAVTNTMGVLAMWLERFFALNAKGVLLPYDDSASETISDSVVA